MEDEVTLLSFWPSQYGIRVKVALAEKGIKYKYIEENLRPKSPLLLEMNPVYTKIPVLIHNGKPICESILIVEYIDEVWSDKSPLLPTNSHQRALARFWGGYVDTLYDLGRKVILTKGEDQEAAKKELLNCLKLLERELGDKVYFGGKDFGYVDVILVPYYCWFYSYGTCGNFSIEEECPKLVAWAKRCMEKESVATSLPDPQEVYVNFVLLLKKKFGVE